MLARFKKRITALAIGLIILFFNTSCSGGMAPDNLEPYKNLESMSLSIRQSINEASSPTSFISKRIMKIQSSAQALKMNPAELRRALTAFAYNDMETLGRLDKNVKAKVEILWNDVRSLSNIARDYQASLSNLTARIPSDISKITALIVEIEGKARAAQAVPFLPETTKSAMKSRATQAKQIGSTLISDLRSIPQKIASSLSQIPNEIGRMSQSLKGIGVDVPGASREAPGSQRSSSGMTSSSGMAGAQATDPSSGQPAYYQRTPSATPTPLLPSPSVRSARGATSPQPAPPRAPYQTNVTRLSSDGSVDNFDAQMSLLEAQAQRLKAHRVEVRHDWDRMLALATEHPPFAAKALLLFYEKYSSHELGNPMSSEMYDFARRIRLQLPVTGAAPVVTASAQASQGALPSSSRRVMGCKAGSVVVTSESVKQVIPRAQQMSPELSSQYVAEISSGEIFCMDMTELTGIDLKPKAMISYFEAERLCSNKQMRLCSSDEWLSACKSGGVYFYDKRPRRAVCNLSGSGSESALPTLRTTKCKFNKLQDMLGNLSEWTQDGLVRGGDFETAEADVSCAYQERRRKDSQHSSVGVRCCSQLTELTAR